MKNGKRLAVKNGDTNVGASKKKAKTTRIKKGKTDEGTPKKKKATRAEKRAARAAMTPLRRYRPLIIAAGVIVVLVIGGIIFWNTTIKPPPIPPSPTPEMTTDPSGNPTVVVPSVSPGGVDLSGLIRDPNIRTILGYANYDGSNTDTIMVGVLDYKKHTLNVISIPRDTTVRFNDKTTKINAVHARSKKDDALNNLMDEVKNILGFRPDSSVYIRANAFKDMVDAVGGIYFDVPVTMSKPSENIYLKKGPKILSGNEALMLLRYRGYGSGGDIPNDDFGRMYMQQQFLKAAAKQILVPSNITKIPEFVKIFQDNVTTSLNWNEMVWYATEVMTNVDIDNINFYTLPTKSVNKSYEYVVVGEALKMINDYVNPYTTEIKREHLNYTYYFKTRADSSPVKP